MKYVQYHRSTTDYTVHHEPQECAENFVLTGLYVGKNRQGSEQPSHVKVGKVGVVFSVGSCSCFIVVHCSTGRRYFDDTFQHEVCASFSLVLWRPGRRDQLRHNGAKIFNTLQIYSIYIQGLFQPLLFHACGDCELED